MPPRPLTMSEFTHTSLKLVDGRSASGWLACPGHDRHPRLRSAFLMDSAEWT